MFKAYKLAVVGVALLCITNAYAIPVQFTYTSTTISHPVTGSLPNIPGVSLGDVVTLTLLADNGGSGLNSQSWTIGNLISGSLSVGSYWQSYTDGWFESPSWVPFTTDAFGNLTKSVFSGTDPFGSPNHQDTFGSGLLGFPLDIVLYNGTIQAYGGGQAYYGPLDSLDRWTVSQVSPVPEPETYAMMLFGLGLVVFHLRLNKGK